MFTEAIAPIGNALSRLQSVTESNEREAFNSVEKAYREQQKADKAEEKNQINMYNSQARMLNAQAKIDAVAYANRLADMSEQRGVHVANVAGQMQSMAGGINAPVQITPQDVTFRPQQVSVYALGGERIR